jgi:hypothetical protein
VPSHNGGFGIVFLRVEEHAIGGWDPDPDGPIPQHFRTVRIHFPSWRRRGPCSKDRRRAVMTAGAGNLLASDPVFCGFYKTRRRGVRSAIVDRVFHPTAWWEGSIMAQMNPTDVEETDVSRS